MSSEAAGAVARDGRDTVARVRSLVIAAAMPILVVVMILGFASVEPRIVSPANLANILGQVSYLAIFAAAQMIVILTRGFDLSLGMCVSAVSVLTALIMTGMVGAHGGDGTGGGLVYAGIALAVVAGIGFGAAVGLFNGFCVSVLGVNPFIVTLGSLNICYGIATTISGGRPVFNVPQEFSNLFYTGQLFGIPTSVFIAAAVLLAIWLLLTRTVLGRSFYLIGSNPRAAKVAGIPSRLYLTLAYVLCSVLAAIGAMLLTARTGSGEPNLGGNLTLESIAAAVIGGVSLRGGIGGVGAALIGALFVTVLSNAMNLTRIDGYVQMIVLGSVIILAVFVDRLRAAWS